MGGETPGAKRANQEKKTGKRLKFADDKNTNKYYASGQPSVISNTPADTRGNINAVPQANNVSLGAMDERSADKKYYATRVPAGAKPVARHLIKAAEQASRPSDRLQQATSSLTIRHATEVNPVMDEVVRRIQDSGPDVVLVVNTAPGPVLRRARTKLDSLVTRQLLTEDQSRQVRFSAIAEEVFSDVPPVPAETVRTEAVDAELDVDAILAGESEIEDAVDTTPQNVHEDEGDDTDDFPDEAPETTTEEVEQPADEVDPLDPATPDLTEEAATEEQTEETSPEVSDEAEEEAVETDEEPEDDE